MALAIAATVDPGTLAVRLTITGGTVEYTVQASPAGDRPPYTVRSTYSPITGDPTGRVALDGDAPLNTPIQYVATDAAGVQASSAIVTPTSAVPILSDATDPSRAVAVTVVSQPPNEWAARSVWWPVLGQTEPFASIAPMLPRSGDLVLRTEERAERAALVSLFAPGTPLVLRSTCPDAVDDVVMLAERIREQLLIEDDPAGPRHWSITYQSISRDLGPYVNDPGRTYAAVAVETSTYAALLAAYPTYAALLTGDPYAGLGAEQLVNRDFTAGLTSWGIGWSADVAITSPAGTALVTATGGAGTAYGTLDQPAGAPLTAIPAGPRILRVTGRVRSTSSATVLWAWLWTNNAPNPPAPFAPGAALTAAPITPALGVWSPFAVDLAVPAGDDVWAVMFRAEAMPYYAAVEWDDLSARWRT